MKETVTVHSEKQKKWVGLMIDVGFTRSMITVQTHIANKKTFIAFEIKAYCCAMSMDHKRKVPLYQHWYACTRLYLRFIIVSVYQSGIKSDPIYMSEPFFSTDPSQPKIPNTGTKKPTGLVKRRP